MDERLIDEILEDVGLEKIPENEGTLVATKTIQEVLQYILNEKVGQ